MKLKNLLLASTLISSSLLANEFVDYKTMSSKLVKENKKAGNYATVEDVKMQLPLKTG